MKKIKLTKEQRIMLIGLRAVFRENNAVCESATKAASKVVGENPEEHNRASDWIWSEDSLSRLEELLNYDQQVKANAKKRKKK